MLLSKWLEDLEDLDRGEEVAGGMKSGEIEVLPAKEGRASLGEIRFSVNPGGRLYKKWKHASTLVRCPVL